MTDKPKVWAIIDKHRSSGVMLFQHGHDKLSDGDKLIRLLDYEALQSDRDQQYQMKVMAREQRDAVTAELEALKANPDSWQSGYVRGRTEGTKTAINERDQLREKVEELQEYANMIQLMDSVDNALEDLELHGRHSDQGYNSLKDWYRKMLITTKKVDPNPPVQ